LRLTTAHSLGLKLFEQSGETADRDVAVAALLSQPDELRHSNLSQCHGLSGIGEIYLEAARVLGEPRWLNRAERIATVLLQLSRITEGGATWLVENPFHPTADLMVGCGGVAHFLLRFAEGHESLGAPLLVDPLPKGGTRYLNRAR
jgi:lantibiotic modifying enzyme